MSTGVQRLGPDTYTITGIASTIRGGAAAARGIALTEANEYCQKTGKEALVKNVGQQNLNNSADIVFRCLSSNDPELQQRPDYTKIPDVVVQHQHE
jgi:hypothetical protein